MAAPNRALLITGGVLVALSLAAIVWMQTRPPCPCKDHTDGEAPLEAVAAASARMAGDD